MRGERAVVKVLTWKLADIRMHPELNVQLEHLLLAILPTQLLVKALHEGAFKAVPLGFAGKDSGRKLQGVADDDNPQDLEFDDRNEKLEISRLTSFVHD